MRFADIFKMCFDSLSRRKGRTILTVLGVFIGCTSIIVMVSIGAGMQESYDQMLKNMGDLSIIEVYRGYNQSTGTQTESKLDEKAVESFHEIAGVKAVMPKASLDDYNISFKAGINGRYTANWVDFAGIDSSALEDMGYELVAGRYPESSDEVVVGQYFAYNFFDTLMPDGRNYVDRYTWDENGNIDTENVPDPFFDPLKTDVKMLLTSWDDSGNETTPYSVDLKVVGILKEDQGKGYETSEGVMMDINALKALIQDLTGKTDTKFEYSSINVKAESLEAVPDVEQAIKDLGYSTYSMQSLRDELNKQTRQIELMLGGLGAISLLVAAIGITNTMIMSISERTKEIGIMKALGCYVRDIRAMFLMEAGSIGLLGGILGLIFSFIISVIINLFSFGAFSGGGVTWELIKQALIGGENVTRVSVIKPELIIFALVFSVLVGLVSGYQPANKAVKISALEAIRNE
jgi:putative ABC transport system permease protein